MKDQKELIDRDDWDWIIWLDGGRYDVLSEMYAEYVDGDIQQVHNRDIGYTGDWCVEMLSRDFGDRGLFSSVPLGSVEAVDYNPERWFKIAPEYDDWASVKKRLASLGYAEDSGRVWESNAETINDMVRVHLGEVSGGVIRYTDTHPPFDGIQELTRGSQKTRLTRDALESGDLTREELVEAYEREMRTALEGIANILSDIEGRIVVTADHGECLYGDGCQQLFHSRRHDPHDHLVGVPWLEVER